VIDLSGYWHIRDETDWFAQTYGPEIATLRGLYGDDNVRVGWGLLVWTS
jgi:hypothetical protein